jgi:hypothetical protein
MGKRFNFLQKAFASEAAYKVMTNLRSPEKPVKRKIGYGDEERASVRLKLGEMMLDDDSSMNNAAIQEGDEELQGEI